MFLSNKISFSMSVSSEAICAAWWDNDVQFKSVIVNVFLDEIQESCRGWNTLSVLNCSYCNVTCESDFL